MQNITANITALQHDLFISACFYPRQKFIMYMRNSPAQQQPINLCQILCAVIFYGKD